MNGPRTYQFVAPTSFITSISRRRAKIERRIVFAMRIVEAASSTITAMRKTIWIARAICRIRWETSLPYRTWSTAASFDLLHREGDRLRVLAALRHDVERRGQRVRREVRGQLGVPLAHDLERLCLRDERDPARLHALVRLEEDAELVICFAVALVRDEHVHRELALLVVRPRRRARCRAR